MRCALFLAVFLSFAVISEAQQLTTKSSLLFTDQRLKRLKRDRERQTERWMNFEARVKNVPDSPERGFELALYARVTDDPAIAAQAIAWTLSHPCDRRQVALVRDLNSPAAPTPVSSTACPAQTVGRLAAMRDTVFEQASAPDFHLDPNRFLTAIHATPISDANEIYAAMEIFLVLGRSWSDSVRQTEVQLFNSLPVQFLLTLKPAQVEHPDWKTHLAALALIAVDPNNDSSQFLQGWAIEDRQMLREGPGVAYEFLWADPYLPGVGYQNLDPWFYDADNSRLLARTDWSPASCAVHVSPIGVEAVQCPSGWQNKTMDFGRLKLVPVLDTCTDIEPRPGNATVLLWRLPPNSHMKTTQSGKTILQQVDRAGMWRVPTNVSGKVCAARQ